MAEIQSRDNAAVKEYCRLVQGAAARRESGRFAAESVKLVTDLAAVSAPLALYATRQAQAAHPHIGQLGCPVTVVSQPVADKLAGTRTTQGVFGVFALPGAALPRDARRVIVLENVQDPANVGAVLRSAAAFGFDGCLLSAGCADPFGPKALRAGMSAALKLPVVPVGEIAPQLEKLRQDGFVVLAACLENARFLSEYEPLCAGGQKIALAIGSEGQGLSDKAIAAAGDRVKIPIAPAMESLNAAVAAAVLMYQFRSEEL